MKLEGPNTYRIFALSPGWTKLGVESSDGSGRFSRLAASKGPKLYVVSVRGRPIYVGITRQRMRQRLRYGFAADGKNGYHGYAFRHVHDAVALDVWYHLDPRHDDDMLDIETIEAEVVFLIRQQGQWPASQTEIHFHPSVAGHRRAAAQILSHFRHTRTQRVALDPSRASR